MKETLLLLLGQREYFMLLGKNYEIKTLFGSISLQKGQRHIEQHPAN
jgi:hypothetical protein